MSQKSDLPDELPPTESQVASKIDAALDNVLDELGLDPDQKSIKYEKYVYLTASGFPGTHDPPISYSWFRWGVSTLAGDGGGNTSGPLYTSRPGAATILDADSTELEDFIMTEIPDFPIQEWWEKPEFEFLKGFYEIYADEYQHLYLANIELLESIEFVENIVQREEDLITEQTYRLATEYTSQLEREVASFSEVDVDLDAVKYFSELYRDVVLTLAELSGDDIEQSQQTAVTELADLYKESLWPMLAHGLSKESAEGPNCQKIVDWATDNRDRLREEFESTNVREICEFAELLRDFKTYSNLGQNGRTEQTAGSVRMQEVLNNRDDHPVLDDFIDEYSLRNLADLVDLTPEYANGNLTYRGVGNAVGLSYGSTFDLLEVLVPMLEGEQEAERICPDDVDEETREEILSGIDL